jgi:hypothetical protein
MKEAPQTNPDQDKWSQEQEYATPAIAPIRQFRNQALTWL